MQQLHKSSEGILSEKKNEATEDRQLKTKQNKTRLHTSFHLEFFKYGQIHNGKLQHCSHNNIAMTQPLSLILALHTMSNFTSIKLGNRTFTRYHTQIRSFLVQLIQ
jgi:hypothetical protein